MPKAHGVSPATVQRILTVGTMGNPDALRAPTAPRRGSNYGRRESRCFIQSVLRAILLHFRLAYDHPFEDGNVRTAKALFYWYLQTRSYRLILRLAAMGFLERRRQGRGCAFGEFTKARQRRGAEGLRTSPRSLQAI
jgi:hypothetical protein